MIGTQTKALFLDAYRDLNARKMFWIVLVVNVLVIVGFAALGISGGRLAVFNWRLPFDLPMPTFFYKWIFSYVIVGTWLTWAATILALISTASIFPDFMVGGTIELYMSKPISRLRLFLTKYVTGLLFVALQVTVFTVGGFIVLGTRGGVWEPGIFMAIPIVLLFFSYLFSICVLFGVLTRSTLAAFFMTLIAWCLIFGINFADKGLEQADDIYRQEAEDAQKRMVQLDSQIVDLQKRVDAATQPAQAPEAGQLRFLKGQRDRAKRQATEQQPPAWFKTIQPYFYAADLAIPKTRETTDLLNRVMFNDMVLQSALANVPDGGPMHGWRRQMRDLLHARSMVWILGSSIAFEVVMLSLAGWRFCRRDF